MGPTSSSDAGVAVLIGLLLWVVLREAFGSTPGIQEDLRVGGGLEGVVWLVSARERG